MKDGSHLANVSKESLQFRRPGPCIVGVCVCVFIQFQAEADTLMAGVTEWRATPRCSLSLARLSKAELGLIPTNGMPTSCRLDMLMPPKTACCALEGLSPWQWFHPLLMYFLGMVCFDSAWGHACMPTTAEAL